MKTSEQYEAIISTLSRQLAAERLRADQGWARYENANMGQKLAREELARIASNEANAKLPEPSYYQIAANHGYSVGSTFTGKYFYVYPDMSISKKDFDGLQECWKAACEDNGLLGERLKPSLSTKGSA